MGRARPGNSAEGELETEKQGTGSVKLWGWGCGGAAARTHVMSLRRGLRGCGPEAPNGGAHASSAAGPCEQAL